MSQGVSSSPAGPRTWWPGTLFGRVALVVCAGLAVAHLLTFWIILRERGEQGLAMMTAYVGRDVAASVAILDRLAPAERAAWLPRLARQNYHYSLAAPTPGSLPTSALAEPVSRSIREQLGDSRAGPITEEPARDGAPPRLQMPLRLTDGTALTLHLAPPPLTVSRTTLALLALQLAALAVAVWAGVRLAVRPLRRLSHAAERLQPGLPGPALEEAGPREVRQAARAFNALQQRVADHLAERMHLLSAISHDLQTPITRMRLRAEQVADEALRHRLQDDLAGMQALVEEGLTYARTAHAAQEPARAVDLDALLDALVCDAVDAGQTVRLSGRLAQPLFTRPQALRRVVGNLLDNAVKFGGSAEVHVQARTQATSGQDGAEDGVVVTVCDRGPGIPEPELDAVMKPFYRLESSRSRETGGTGLGLAIAQQLTQALQGRLTLCNREGGGLQAELVLPVRPRV